jgi:hypothetical protein
MNDSISRQAAIELIKNYCENGCDIAEDNWCPSCQREQFIELLKALPSAQSANSSKISYSVICEKFPNPHIYFNTYDEAEHWARFNQPNYRPYYIIEHSEHFEIVGEVR